MKFVIMLLSFCCCLAASGQENAEQYENDPASIERAGVPKGEVLHFTYAHSSLFPGTWRDYWVYVPAQYKAERPACVYVNQDGIQWKAPTVFDNLIAAGEMPVTIGVFVTPGRVPASVADSANDRFNRSFEYDGLGDTYVKFLLQELLPEVEKQKTIDGREIRLSRSGNDRAIGGSSSGAVCAFTAAWERPNEFSRVFSAIGTYTGLRGAERYPVLIRKYEPKPLRVFLQDGSGDLNIYAGDWWMANQSMERALVFSGYEVNHVWGGGAHNGKHGTAIFPAAMRWLWKDWPRKVTGTPTQNPFLRDILEPGENWELVGSGYSFTEGTAANAKGEVYFQDIPASKTYFVGSNGKPSLLPIDSKKASATAFSADGKRFTAATGTRQLLRYDVAGHETVLAEGIAGNDLVVTQPGHIYVTAPDGSERPGRIILVKNNGEKMAVDSGLKYPNGIALSPDQTQLYVSESATHWVWIYRLQPGGGLAFKQRFGWLHVPDISENAWADGIRCDTSGRIYVTTKMGIQVMDQLGRVNAIIPVPMGMASNCCFGGPDFHTLYVSCGDKVFRRKLKVRGVSPFDLPYKPKKPNM